MARDSLPGLRSAGRTAVSAARQHRFLADLPEISHIGVFREGLRSLTSPSTARSRCPFSRHRGNLGILRNRESRNRLCGGCPPLLVCPFGAGQVDRSQVFPHPDLPNQSSPRRRYEVQIDDFQAEAGDPLYQLGQGSLIWQLGTEGCRA